MESPSSPPLAHSLQFFVSFFLSPAHTSPQPIPFHGPLRLRGPAGGHRHVPPRHRAGERGEFWRGGGSGRHSPPPLLFLSFFCCVLSALAPHPDPPRPRPRSQRTLHPTQAPRDAAPIVISRRAATLAAAAALLAATPRPAAAFLGLGGASRDEEYAKDTVRMWG
jgi:hypothetical protein